LLSTFPWDTDVIQQDLTQIIPDPSYSVRKPPAIVIFYIFTDRLVKNFKNAIIRLEQDLMANRNDVAYNDVSRYDLLTNIMAIVTPEVQSIPTANIERGQASSLIALISAYRLLDVINRQVNPNIPTLSPRHSKLGMANLRPASVRLFYYDVMYLILPCRLFGLWKTGSAPSDRQEMLFLL
jgi:hypothetical protein